MATIRPFFALRPSVEWFGSFQDKMPDLQKQLEADQIGLSMRETQLNQVLLEALLNEGGYQRSDVPSIFIYEQRTFHGSQYGVWAQSSLQDVHNGLVLKHEQTIAKTQQALELYRKMVGLEASPVLLTYLRSGLIDQLTLRAASGIPVIDYCYEHVQHRLWQVSDAVEVKDFCLAFSALPRIFVADGHHRLAAAAASQEKEQWITSLYVSSASLRCSAFHRLVMPEGEISAKLLLQEIGSYYHINRIPGDVPFKPYKEGRLGLYSNGNWYQLDVRNTWWQANLHSDAGFLQQMILGPFFEILDPKADHRLHCYAENQWEDLLLATKQHPNSIVFTIPAISPDRLMHLAINQVILPPKSTYIEPKIPFGLLMHYTREGAAHA